MKSKILLSLVIVFVMVLFVMGDFASAADTASLLTQEIGMFSKSSNGLLEAITCFGVGSFAYWIKGILK